MDAPLGPDALRATWIDARPVPFWLDTPDRPATRPSAGTVEADLVVVGGGFTGLWTALRAKERDPSRSVVLLESGRVAGEATGRNGGFCSYSLTHGAANGHERWPDEMDVLERLGHRNLDEIRETVVRYGIDCHLESTGEITVATRPHELEALRDEPGFVDAATVRALLNSPTYLGGVVDPDATVMVDPARLAWGLASAAESLGVEIFEESHVERLRRAGDRVELVTPGGTVSARHVALATNAFPSLLRRLRLHTVPVYDYVLVTEPLTDEQLAAIGWHGRHGLSDAGNHFHYYRITADQRILWGGYDAVYHRGRRIDPRLDQRPETFQVLAEHFFTTFPQLVGLRFSHRWGGVIDTSTRFCAFFGTSHRGRVAYATGYTGLGVGASRFGADVVLDLLDGDDTERTRLRMVRTKPLPFPPEPLAWIGIALTTRALTRADRTGRRGLWLRLLDRLGLGFDS